MRKVNYKNNYDTILLQSNGIYHRAVYDKNKKILLEINGKWKLEGNSVLNFDNFYVNFDDDLIHFPNNVIDTTAGWRGSLDIKNQSIHFCIGHLQGKYCYRQVRLNS